MNAGRLATGGATMFFRQWGGPMAATGLLAGLGFGFWMYVSDLNKRAEKAEAARDMYQGQLLTKTEQAATNAGKVAELTAILEGRQALSAVQLSAEEDRRKAAERRNNLTAGALDDLKKRIETFECGLGRDLSGSLLDNRASRETERRSREDAIADLRGRSVQDGPGPATTDGAGT